MAKFYVKDNLVNGTTTIVKITQAQYNALSDEAKQKGDYLITDIDNEPLDSSVIEYEDDVSVKSALDTINTSLTQKADISHEHSWNDITSGKPTTLSGYGITDGQQKMTFTELTTTCSIAYDSPTNQYLGTVALGSFPNFNSNAKAWIPLGCVNTGYATNVGTCYKDGSYIRCAFTNSVSNAYVKVLQIV